jgi:hypothetical protein
LPASGRHYLSAGSLAITLISNWNPYSQVTPMPVRVGCGDLPEHGRADYIVSARGPLASS